MLVRRYTGEAASIDLAGGLIVADSLPPRALALVAEWARVRHSVLLTN